MTMPEPCAVPAARNWRLWAEARATWSLTYRDLTASVVMSDLALASAITHHGGTITGYLRHALPLTAWLACYIYTFDLSNQLSGVGQDSIDK